MNKFIVHLKKLSGKNLRALSNISGIYRFVLKHGLQKMLRVLNEADTYGPEQIMKIIDIFEREHGHFLSFMQQSCINLYEDPIPWYTYPAIAFLDQFDFSDKNVFEYGSGNSSRFWAKRARTIVSVEHDSDWYLKINEMKSVNQTLMLKDNKSEYINSIDIGAMAYDLIIIDGVYRLNCAKRAIDNLIQGGIIILDNSDWYPNTSRLLRETGLIQIDFTGLGPINYYTWTTSLFFSRDVNLRPKSGRQPQPGIASLIQIALDDSDA